MNQKDTITLAALQSDKVRACPITKVQHINEKVYAWSGGICFEIIDKDTQDYLLQLSNLPTDLTYIELW